MPEINCFCCHRPVEVDEEHKLVRHEERVDRGWVCSGSGYDATPLLALVADAVAAERAECAAIVDQFMIELCGITGDIFSVQYHAKDLARRAVKLAADRIRARGEQRAPIAHAHRCACGKPATHEQCGGLLVCDEHIGPGRA